MLYKSSFETAAQSEMVAALFELYLALMRDVKKGIFYSASWQNYKFSWSRLKQMNKESKVWIKDDWPNVKMLK